MSRRFRATFIAGVVALLMPAAGRADCGPPPATDAELVAAPRAVAAIADGATRLPNGDGRFWRIGTEPPSYLVGTFHVPAGGIEDPGPRLTQVVRDARELFIEIDEPAMEARRNAWAKDPANLFRGAGDRLSSHMTATEKARAEALLAQYGVPFALADQMKPLFLVGLLAVPPCAVDRAGEPGLDRTLETLARAAGVEVTALETVDEQLAALEGAPGELDATIRMMLTQARSLDEDWFLTLALYRTQHIAALWSLSVLAMADEVGPAEAERLASDFWQRLVSARNERMVERMAPALAAGGRVVAVGALHLPGEHGLVALLRARGFSVERADDGR